MSRLATAVLENMAPMASATAMSAPAMSAPDIAEDVVSTTMTYQAAASRTETMMVPPSCLAGRCISSETWGMTSKPTNRNGTVTSTRKKPAVPLVKNGSMVSTEPRVNAPKIIMSPTISRKRITKICTMEACFTPRMLIAVMMTAVSDPTSAQVRFTSKPATVHSGIWLRPGKMYCRVRGTATASKATMVM